MRARTFDPPANGVQAFDIDGGFFRQYRLWKEANPNLEVIAHDTIREKAILLAWYREQDDPTHRLRD